jgi:hypothetical protein
MNVKIVIGALLFTLIAVVATGCSSSVEVRELADKTAANVGTISVHLKRLGQNSRDVAELRAANISRLHAANANLRSRYEYDLELTRMSGGEANLRLIPQIEAWKTRVEDIFEKAKGAEAERKKKILDGQTKLDVKSKALSEIAQALAVLAQEDKPADRVRFLTGYAQDLKSELDKALAADDKAAKAAKELLETAKSESKPKKQTKAPTKPEVKNGGK